MLCSVRDHERRKIPEFQILLSKIVLFGWLVVLGISLTHRILLFVGGIMNVMTKHISVELIVIMRR